MDFILKKINQKLNIFSMQEQVSELNIYSQVRMEYLLFLALGYLWNKNISNLDEQKKEKVFNQILNPTIGSIVQIIRDLDTEKEILSKEVSKSFNDYPEYRNQLIGHGYTFSNKSGNIYEKLNSLYENIEKSQSFFMKNLWSFYTVIKLDNDYYYGIKFSPNGDEEPFKIIKKSIRNLSMEVGNVYISNDLEASSANSFFRVSPFIHLLPDSSSVFCFSKISEKLVGKVTYNKIFETDRLSLEWPEFETLQIQNDGRRIKTQNGTIRNIYNNNYKKYIDIGVKNKLITFLKDGKSSVAAILWGHGGVGKTATIQSVCDDFSNSERKFFDYVIFLSAKDRIYNIHTGDVNDITDRVVNYHDLLASINNLIFDTSLSNTSEIEKEFINFQQKILLVIDDYESFSKEDKSKINDLITKLNINHHKVVITTRSANIKIGEEFQTNELNKSDTIEFLKHIIKNENLIPINILKELESKSEIIHSITSGRPIFIMQLAYIIAARGIDVALKFDIKSDSKAVDFLFGRIFDYLSNQAKELFAIISLLVTTNNLSNILHKAQFILNMEFDNTGFYNAVNELIKLKIIKLDEEEKIFEVYSPEIYQKMSNYFSQFDEKFREIWLERNEQINNPETNIDQALLETANACRLSKPELEVIEAYHRVLERINCSIEIKYQAISMLASYLASIKKKDEALRQISNYKHFFNDISNFHTNLNFTRLYARFSWANGKTEDKENAVKILSDFILMTLSNKSNLITSPHKDEEILDLNGLLMQYSCINVIDALDELKDRREEKTISETEYNLERRKLRQECTRLEKQFLPTWQNVQNQKIDFNSFKSSAKQNIITGLYNYIDVLIRLSKMELAKTVATFMRDNTPGNFYAQFDRKVNYTQKRIEEWNYKNYQRKSKQ